MLIRLRRTALSKTPHALADGLMLVFQHCWSGWVFLLCAIPWARCDFQFQAMVCKMFRKDPFVVFGALLLGVVLLTAGLGPLILSTDPLRTTSSVLMPPSAEHPAWDRPVRA